MPYIVILAGPGLRAQCVNVTADAAGRAVYAALRTLTERGTLAARSGWNYAYVVSAAYDGDVWEYTLTPPQTEWTVTPR